MSCDAAEIKVLLPGLLVPRLPVSDASSMYSLGTVQLGTAETQQTKLHGWPNVHMPMGQMSEANPGPVTSNGRHHKGDTCPIHSSPDLISGTPLVL